MLATKAGAAALRSGVLRRHREAHAAVAVQPKVSTAPAAPDAPALAPEAARVATGVAGARAGGGGEGTARGWCGWPGGRRPRTPAAAVAVAMMPRARARVARISTTAVAKGDEWVLNGNKMWITALAASRTGTLCSRRPIRTGRAPSRAHRGRRARAHHPRPTRDRQRCSDTMASPWGRSSPKCLGAPGRRLQDRDGGLRPTRRARRLGPEPPLESPRCLADGAHPVRDAAG